MHSLAGRRDREPAIAEFEERTWAGVMGECGGESSAWPLLGAQETPQRSPAERRRMCLPCEEDGDTDHHTDSGPDSGPQCLPQPILIPQVHPIPKGHSHQEPHKRPSNPGTPRSTPRAQTSADGQGASGALSPSLNPHPTSPGGSPPQEDPSPNSLSGVLGPSQLEALPHVYLKSLLLSLYL